MLLILYIQKENQSVKKHAEISIKTSLKIKPLPTKRIGTNFYFTRLERISIRYA